MKKIHRLIFFEIVPLFIMVNFFFVFLLLLQQMVELAEFIFVRSMPLSIVIETIVFYMPSFLVVTIPISSLLAVLLAFSRFSSDSELVAMHACGASGLTLMLPTAVFGVMTVLLGLYLNVSLLPKGSTLAVDNLNKMLENLSINDIREREMYNDIEGIIFYANKKIDMANFEEILIVDKNKKAIISAQRGTIIPNQSLSMIMRFEDGKFTMVDSSDEYSSVSFDGMTLNYPLNLTVSSLPMNEKLMGLKDLKTHFGEDNIYKYEYMKRFTMPLSGIIMAFLGLSLGRALHRSSRSVGVVVSCVLAFALNAMFVTGERFIDTVNPFTLAWLPIIIFSAFTLVMLYRVIR